MRGTSLYKKITIDYVNLAGFKSFLLYSLCKCFFLLLISTISLCWILCRGYLLSLLLGTIASLNEQNDSHSSIDMLLKWLKNRIYLIWKCSDTSCTSLTGAVVVVIVWHLELQLHVQWEPITTIVVI